MMTSVIVLRILCQVQRVAQDAARGNPTVSQDNAG
jgi:hypothetical protein